MHNYHKKESLHTFMDGFMLFFFALPPTFNADPSDAISAIKNVYLIGRMKNEL